MDAREYLNRKGVGLDRDPDKPNTLEEKAWERARGSGQQRPKSGTPHDWEDWERFHDDLAEGADTLEQKIDKEAHRKALAREKAASEQANAAVEHFTPPPMVEKATASAQPAPAVHSRVTPDEPAALEWAYRALAVLLPPLALGLTDGGARRVIISVLLTLAGWIPGIIYALVWLSKR
ncbi:MULTISPECIES: YqaE/Pmp3 family membrane protein [Halomonadaceae]|uniref:YqaE/Pmp3 family membrane protein n=1 Tax=Halomonadaceae TaxID=28256 RepID=UPI001118F2D8|nr:MULTISPECIES: YqaE/Pmp3 family membrane protein [Halomonas]TNH13941.1 YqaE/Pmp3 family membrane protein [Halomonas sp. BL6]BCB61828.1 hypothetical protein HaloA020_25290 [Halomonas sp. A020]